MLPRPSWQGTGTHPHLGASLLHRLESSDGDAVSIRGHVEHAR